MKKRVILVSDIPVFTSKYPEIKKLATIYEVDECYLQEYKSDERDWDENLIKLKYKADWKED